MIPPFEAELVSYGFHVLPPGIYQATIDEIVAKLGWNRHRRTLIVGLREALALLRAGGCKRAYVDGSFSTSKDRPQDFDVAWDPTRVDPAAIDPIFFDVSSQVIPRDEQRARFGGEFYPSTFPARPGQTFLDFFQDVKFVPGKRKGILLVELGVGP